MDFQEDSEGVPLYTPNVELWIKESIAVNNVL